MGRAPLGLSKAGPPPHVGPSAVMAEFVEGRANLAGIRRQPDFAPTKLDSTPGVRPSG